MSVEISAATYAEVRPLFAELDADLDERYGAGIPVQVDEADFLAPAGALFVAHIDGSAGSSAGAAVGCAGVRPHAPGVAELKRMYVRRAARGRGVARALLVACEQFAIDACYDELWLETGTAQPEALALYLSAGYRPVARFGQYAEAPDARHLGRRLPAPASSS